ncbi:MAG: class I SAM-dependent methyltransferase [Patescibacteria group bacterium]
MTLALIAVFFLFLIIFGIFVFLADSSFGGLDFSTNRETIKQVVGIIKQRHLESGNFYDLGSARGNFASQIAGVFPNLRVTGIDNNSLRLLVSKIRTMFLKNINFQKENIFKTNVSSADVIYIYLPKELMPELQAKLQKELKPGSMVITNKVSFPNWPLVEKLNELFIYAKV